MHLGTEAIRGYLGFSVRDSRTWKGGEAAGSENSDSDQISKKLHQNIAEHEDDFALNIGCERKEAVMSHTTADPPVLEPTKAPRRSTHPRSKARSRLGFFWDAGSSLGELACLTTHPLIFSPFPLRSRPKLTAEQCSAEHCSMIACVNTRSAERYKGKGERRGSHKKFES